MKISYSNLEAFETCPKKYEFQAVEKIQVPKSGAQFFGNALHKTLRFLFRKAPLFPSLDEIFDYFRIEWQNADKAKWRTEKEKEIYFNEGKRILENFYKKNIPTLSSIIALESSFQAPIEDEEKEVTHILTGIIDRIDKIEDNEFEIIDYKTTSHILPQSSLSNHLQLSIYTLGFLTKWPFLTSLENLNLTLYYLKHNEKLSTKLTTEDIIKTKNRVLKNIREIEKNYFPPIPSPLCRSCPYRSYCPMWSHLYQSSTPEESEIKKLISEYFCLKTKLDQDKAKLNLIKQQINNYLEKKGLERIFGEEGYFQKSEQIQVSYDLEKLKKILQPYELWEEVLSLDKKKLEKLMKNLSPEIKKAIEEAKLENNRKILKAVKKSLAQIKKELDEE